MFSTIRARIGTLTDQQAKYVAAVKRGASEANAMVEAGYKTKPRASAIERALAGLPVGEFSDKALNYAFRLAIERISKQPLDEGFETWQMQRGHELEPAARMMHEFLRGVYVEPVGFITTADGKFGASADGFIGTEEGAEYKCFVSPEKLRAIYLTGDVSEVIDQCDGGMWITGRKRWTFGLYCPALKPIGLDMQLFDIERDDDRIEALELDLIEFEKLVSEYESILRAKAKAGSEVVFVDSPALTVADLSAPWDTAPAPAAAPVAKPVTRTTAPAALPENIFA